MPHRLNITTSIILLLRADRVTDGYRPRRPPSFAAGTLLLAIDHRSPAGGCRAAAPPAYSEEQPVNGCCRRSPCTSLLLLLPVLETQVGGRWSCSTIHLLAIVEPAIIEIPGPFAAREVVPPWEGSSSSLSL